MAWIDSASADISVAKTNLFPIGAGDPTKYIQATQDWNKLRTGALDIRDWIRGDVLNWYGFGNQAGDPTPASIASYIYATATDIKFKQGATLKNVFDDRGLGILELISYTGGTLAPALKMWFRNNAGTPEYSYNGGAWTAFSGAIYTASLGVSLVGNDFRLNQAYSPTWTASHLFNAAAVGITENVDVAIKTTTAAALGAQQWSPGFSLAGNGWATGTAASMPVEYLHQLEVFEGVTVPSGGLAIKSRHNGGAWTKFYQLFDNVNSDQAMLRITGRAQPVLQARQNSTTTGNADIEAFNDLTGFIRIRSFGSAAVNAANLGGAAAAAAGSNGLSSGGRLDIFTTGADDVIIGTSTTPRTTWTGGTGNITHAANFTLSTTKTLSAGANTLIGSIADKLNAVHLAIASQAIGDLLIADAATTFARLPDVAVGSVLASGGVGALPAYTATPTLTSLGLAAGLASAASLYQTGDTNTGIYFPAADQFAVTTAGSLRWLIDGSTELHTLIQTGPAGSASLPTYGFTGDPNTGAYSIGADQYGITAGGTLRLTVSTTGVTSTLPVLGPNGSAVAPAFGFSGDAGEGMYLSAANTVAIAAAGALAQSWSATAAISYIGGAVRSELDDTGLALTGSSGATVNSDVNVLTLLATNTGTTLAGFSCGISFEAKNAAAGTHAVAAIYGRFTDPADTTEDAELDFYVANGGGTPKVAILTGVGAWQVGAGSASLPSMTFTSDTNTGLFSTAADAIGVGIGGTERFKFDGSRFSAKFGSGSYPANYDGVAIGSSSSCAFHAVCSNVSLFAGLTLENDSGGSLVASIWGSSAAGTRFGEALAGAAEIRAISPMLIGTSNSNTVNLGTNDIARIRLGTDAEAASTTAVYVSVNGTMQRVSVGANDSAGAGFRQLRIPN